jgi:3-methyladenine DNA glycosylase AlkD
MPADRSAHTQTFRDFIHANASPDARPPKGYTGTTHVEHGLRIPALRDFVKSWSASHKQITFDEWLLLLDDLYHGASLEEKAVAAMLVDRFKTFRARLPLSKLNDWLGQLEGWAEVDATCQGIFTAPEILARWDEWKPFLRALSHDANINKRRASLVMLTKVVDKSADSRPYALAIEHIERLKHEKDNRITKAISWVLRDMLNHHRDASAAYVDANAASLPSIAVREYRKKSATGKK